VEGRRVREKNSGKIRSDKTGGLTTLMKYPGRRKKSHQKMEQCRYVEYLSEIEMK